MFYSKLLWGLAFTTLSSTTLGTEAAEPTPIPEFTGEQLYVRGVEDVYGSLREDIQRIAQDSRQTYYVVVVASSGTGEGVTREYTDRLVAQWSATAQREQLPWDRERAVVIVLAEQNRSISLHFGSELQSRFALEGAKINRELVDPVFLPQARAGNYPEGLRRLLESTERFIVTREAAERTATPAKEPPPAEQTGGATPVASSETNAAGPTAGEARQAPLVTGELVAGPARPPAPAAVPESGSFSGLAAGLAIVGAGLVAVGGGRFWWYQRRRRSVQAAFEDFKHFAVSQLERMESLKKRHEFLPFSDTDFKESLEGDTLAYYNRFDEVFGELRQKWLAVMDTRQRIEASLLAVGFLSTAPLRQAHQEIQGLDRKALEQLQTNCEHHLQQLEQAHEQAREKLQAIQERTRCCSQAMEALAGQGVAIERHKQVLLEFEQPAAAATAKLTRDPLGAAQLAATVLTGLQQQLELCQTLANQATRTQELRGLAAEAEARSGEHRQQGLRFVEIDPDPLLQSARQACEQSWTALNDANAKEADLRLQQAAAYVEEAQRGMQQQLEARSLCERDLPERRRETAQLGERLVRSGHELDVLRREFAGDSWLEVASHAEESRRLLEDLRSQQALAEQLHDRETQRYLQAAELARAIQEQQQRVAGLLNQISQRLSELSAIRESCRSLWQQVVAQADQATDHFHQQRQIVGNQTQQRFAAAAAAREQITGELARPTPHWPRLQEMLGTMREAYSAAHQQAQADVRACAEFRTRSEVLRREVGRIGQLLRSSTADRPRANQRYQSAQTALANLLADSARRPADWSTLLQQLEIAETDLKKAEQFAQEDLRLADQAAAELREAEREVQLAGAFVRQGVTCDVTTAHRLLDQARGQLAAQAYEQAIELAQRAEQEARTARAAAERQAEQRRQNQEREEQQRRAAAQAAAAQAAAAQAAAAQAAAAQAAAAQAAAVQAAVSHTTPLASPAAAVPPAAAPPPPSRSSTQSWESGTSERSW